MANIIRSLLPPLFSLVLMILGSGLFNTFISIRLEMEGYETEVIGAVTSALYLGILVGSFKIDRWIAKVGHIHSFLSFAIISTLLILLQSIWIDPWYWAVLRFLGGICMAGVFIVIESWLLMLATPNLRGGILSIYLGVFYGALSLGQLLINVSDPRGIYPFFITAGLTALSILPISYKKIEAPTLQSSKPMGLYQFFKISPIGFLGGTISGMLLAAIYGLLPVYANEIGMSVSEIGSLMSILIFGGLSLQWPFGRWADGGNRRFVLNIASCLTALVGVLIALQNPIDPTYLFILAWLFGGFSFTLYPLSMGCVCERVKEDQIVAATGGFVLSYGIGAIAGPLLAPLTMDWLGSCGLFYFLSVIALLLGLFGLFQTSPIVAPTEEEPD